MYSVFCFIALQFTGIQCLTILKIARKVLGWEKLAKVLLKRFKWRKPLNEADELSEVEHLILYG